MNGMQNRSGVPGAGAQRRSRMTNGWLVGCYAAFAAAVLYTLYIESFHFDLALFRGMFVPDTVNISATFDDQATLTGGIPFEESLKGPSLLYGWLWLVEPSLCVWLNLLMMLGSGLIIARIAHVVDAPRWAVLGLFLNPYIILAAVGPNKEIPLILLTSIWVSLVVNRPTSWQAGTLLVAVLAYLIRDGYGASLAIAALFIMTMRARAEVISVSYLLMCVAISGLFGVLISIIPILARNYSGFQEGFNTGTAVGNLAAAAALDPLSFTGGIILFILRMFYNALTLGIFPILQTEYLYIFWLGYSYWIFGITNFLTICSSVFLLIRYRNIEGHYPSIISSLVVVTWCSISVSQFVQPRYMMPVIPFGFCAFSTLPGIYRKYLLAASLSVIVAIIGLYFLSGQAASPAAITLHDPPAFLWANI